MKWLGLDIGGANIKAATSDGEVFSMPFRFWVDHHRLADVLVEIIERFPNHRVAATMTAELADCFDSRRVGVEYVVDSLNGVCDRLGIAAPIYAGTDLNFRTGADAKQHWLKTAASNWAILASYASRFLNNATGLVVDMGSTTTDIIPVQDGKVVARGKTDSQRLRARELIYVGVDRTPICSVVDELTFNGTPIAREFFATVGDAMIVSGFSDEDPSDTDTADGRPKTITCSAQRICRMICEDLDEIGIRQAKLISHDVLEQLEKIIIEAIEYRRHDPQEIIVSGSGQVYVRGILEMQFPKAYIKPLSVVAGADVNEAAPAFAVAVLASERFEK